MRPTALFPRIHEKSGLPTCRIANSLGLENPILSFCYRVLHDAEII